jgi:hypothetical protein
MLNRCAIGSLALAAAASIMADAHACRRPVPCSPPPLDTRAAQPLPNDRAHQVKNGAPKGERQ